jgi:hypothetical protein
MLVYLSYYLDSCNKPQFSSSRYSLEEALAIRKCAGYLLLHSNYICWASLMCLLVCCAPCSHCIAEVSALVVNLGVITHLWWCVKS